MEKQRRKAVTMEDVAKAAGVSVTTVSHVINRTAKLLPETQQRVQAAMEALGYLPRNSAALNRGSRTIGVFTPDISNEFYAKTVQAIFEAAWEQDYAVMVCSTQHHHKAGVSYVRSLLQQDIRGLIFLGSTAEEHSKIEAAAKQVPVVLGDQRLTDLPADCVGTDNAESMMQLVSRLVRSGYKRIGYVSEDPALLNARDRYEGYRTGMAQHGLTPEPETVILSEQLRLNKAENAFSVMQELLKQELRLPQVFLCSSDLIAMGVMTALKAAGYAIPRDIGVVGFDNISIAAYTEPPLTTVAQNMRQLGRSCFAALLRRMEAPDSHPYEQTVVRSKFIVRGSVRL